MNSDHYAILIGINSYPGLAEPGKSADLRGPVNDVNAMMAWLMDPEGGGVPPDNVFAIRAETGALADATREQIELKVIKRLDDIAKQNSEAGRGLQVGRRLYIYMSGHGFSPDPQRGCLFMANASADWGYNVHATGWLNWLQDRGYFREYVLWMDCCMNREEFTPGDLIARPGAASVPPRASLVAFAAPRPQKAVEVPIAEDGNNVHGAFTWALLQGLRGAAADQNGQVTGRSLADWVRNAQIAWLGERDLKDSDVSREPSVLREDSGLVLARGVVKTRFKVGVSFAPAAAGLEAVLWAGAPPVRAQRFPVKPGAPQRLDLEPGLYLIEVPDATLRQGFEVVKDIDNVMIETVGAPVQESPGAMFRLYRDASEIGAEVYIVDSRFCLVDGGPPPLRTKLPFGLFKIKTRMNRNTVQEVILLDADNGLSTETPKPVAVTPVYGTATSHEYHVGARQEMVRIADLLNEPPKRAVLAVMARSFSGMDEALPGTEPWRGVAVVDAAGQTVLDLESEGVRGPLIAGQPGPTLDPARDPYAFCVKGVEPGSYFLRQRRENGITLEQSIIVCAGWRHEVYVLRRVQPGEDKLASRPRVAVMMRRLGTGAELDEESRWIETARLALADERRVLSEELESLLLLKCQNPMAGIILGHLLLVERERDPGRNISKLDGIVANLLQQLGRQHADVAALALQCSRPDLRNVGPLVGPPMFQRSWTLLIDAAQQQPDLIPAAMFGRMVATNRTTLPPMLAWAADENVKENARQALASVLEGKRPVTTPAPLEPALADAHVDVAAVRAILPVDVAARALEAIQAKVVSREERLKRLAQMRLPPSALEVVDRADN
jgi:hypothetical protein